MEHPNAKKGPGDPCPISDAPGFRAALSAHKQQYAGCSYSPAAEGSPGWRAERLLHHLGDFTGMTYTNDASLPVEFRVSLQVAEHMAQQTALLHELGYRIEDMRSEFCTNLYSVKEDLLQTLSGKNQNCQHTSCDPVNVMDIQCCPGVAGWSRRPGNLPQLLERSDVAQQPRNGHDDEQSVHWQSSVSAVTDDRESFNAAPSTYLQRSNTVASLKSVKEGDEPPFGISTSSIGIDFSSAGEDFWLRKVISHPVFEWVCTAVIISNAVTIGVSAERAVAFSITHPGTIFIDNSIYISILNKLYIAFYFIELSLKLVVFRREFFCGPNWRWNMFDLLLVIAGIYDIVIEISGGSGGMKMTGLRILRIVKTLKLLRVIRVMRSFQELRLMVSSIAGSLVPLFWSCLIIALILYMFGLSFLQAVTGFLNETRYINPETMERIQDYWSSVGQSMMTLFWAVTGGADWEELARPIRQADPFFYGVFYFYIAFAALALLNVLTGMFVDAAMKVSQMDEQNAVEELVNRDEIKNFSNFMRDYECGRKNGCEGFISTRFIDEREDEAFVEFMKVLEIDREDCHKVLKMLDSEKKGHVDLDEFINGCCHMREGNLQALDLAVLKMQTSHLNNQLAISMEYLEARFDEMLPKGRRSAVGKFHDKMVAARHSRPREKTIMHSTEDWSRQIARISKNMGRRISTSENSSSNGSTRLPSK